jgi:guanine nucleotide-binding protein subunit alpha
MPGAFKSSSSSSSQSSWPPPPPANETPDERKARLEEEALAKKRSDQIDKELNAEKESKKRKLGAKILLLGASLRSPVR